MKLFTSLYEIVMKWSRHPRANQYLVGVSFFESFCFPIPTSMMLAPMIMSRRDKAWWLAAITTIASVLGGIVGYLIGFFLFDSVAQPIIDFYHGQAKFDQITQWFAEYGVWLVLIAGVSPIPYKIITIASGVLGLALLPFILASILGRASQFFLVAALIKWGGDKIESTLHIWIEWVGWGIIVLAVVAYLALK